MKYSEVETGRLLRHPDKSIYVMVIEKRIDSFDYIKYRDAKTILHRNIESKYWDMTDYAWKIFKYIESRRTLHSIIRMIFVKGLYHD